MLCQPSYKIEERVVNKELGIEISNFNDSLPLALFPVGDGSVYEKPPEVSHPKLSGACNNSRSTGQISMNFTNICSAVSVFVKIR